MPERKKITPAEIPLEYRERTRKVTIMGNVTEVQLCYPKNSRQYIEILPGRKYVDLSTGEVKDFKESETRADQKGSLRRTFKKLREIINANTENPKNCRWCTLTYAENMTDTERLYNDFRKFNQRFMYWCNKQGHGKPEYISVVEPQGRGAWHCHVLYIWDKDAPYIPNQTYAELWGQGFVKVQALQDCDNIGAYLTAYLADIPVEEAEVGQTGEVKEVNGKKYLKGGRLHMYPPGMNLYRTSRGIKKAEVKYLSPSQIDTSKLGGLTYHSTIELEHETGSKTFIDTQYYNRRR